MTQQETNIKKMIPRYEGTLRKHILRVPEVIRECSGIVIFGRRIKSLVFTTDVAIIRNINADAVIAVYPFTPQPIITQALLLAADIPVFAGVGGGLTTGRRVTMLAGYAEVQGATAVVMNAPTSNEILAEVAKVVDMLEYVGLGGQHLNRYPHEFSGGQRQRIGIARALVLEPEFIMCDEPVSALDVSVRAQVLNLMRRIQAERGLTYLFISHDLSVVRHISDRIGVMYLGRLVEVTSKDELYRRPLHPYTKALLSAIPIPDPEVKRERVLLKGDVSSAYDPPTGCRFAARCPYATDRCRSETPALRELAPGHQAACVRAEELA